MSTQGTQKSKMFQFGSISSKNVKELKNSTDLDSSLKEAEKSSVGNYRPYTELRLAEDISEELKESYAHSRELGFLYYDGKRYQKDAEVEVKKALVADLKEKTTEAHTDLSEAQKENKENKNAETDAELKRAKAWFDLCASHQSQVGIEKLSKLQELQLDNIMKFDTKPHLLVCQNGVVNLKDGTLFTHSREYALTQLCPTSYIRGSKCFKFKAFLSDIFLGDTDMIDWMQKWLGYNITSEIGAQLWTQWLGDGGNGKSILAQILCSVLGDDYVCRLPKDAITKLTSRNPDAPSPSLMRLRAKRFVYVSETEQNEKLASSLVKSLVGESTFPARGHYKNTVDLPITFKLNVYTNYALTMDDNTKGAMRRIVIVPFKYEVPVEKVIKDLDKVLVSEESEGILLWLVEGATKYYKEGLMPLPSTIVEATEKYKKEQNPIIRFIEECCEIDKDYKAHVKATFETFKTWQSDTEGVNNTWVLSRFRQAMESTGYKKADKRDENGYYFKGFRLKMQTIHYQGNKPLLESLKEGL